MNLHYIIDCWLKEKGFNFWLQKHPYGALEEAAVWSYRGDGVLWVNVIVFCVERLDYSDPSFFQDLEIRNCFCF